MQRANPWPVGESILEKFRSLLFKGLSDEVIAVFKMQAMQELDSSSSSSSSRAKVLLKISAALTQIPQKTTQTYLQDLNNKMFAHGLNLLARTTQKLQQRRHHTGSSSSISSSRLVLRSDFTPSQISNWLTDMSKVVGMDLSVPDRKALAVALLDYTSKVTSCAILCHVM